MKKILFLGLMIAALAGAAVQKASAGVVVGARIGVPVAPGYYAPRYYAPAYNPGYCPSPAYYGYGYNNYGYNNCAPGYYGYPYPSIYIAPPVFGFSFGYGGYGHYGHGYYHGGYHGGFHGGHGHHH